VDSAEASDQQQQTTQSTQQGITAIESSANSADSVSSTTQPKPATSERSPRKLPVGAIIGIITAALIAVVFAVASYLFIRHRRRQLMRRWQEESVLRPFPQQSSMSDPCSKPCSKPQPNTWFGATSYYMSNSIDTQGQTVLLSHSGVTPFRKHEVLRATMEAPPEYHSSSSTS
jgi:hypothetical protein